MQTSGKTFFTVRTYGRMTVLSVSLLGLVQPACDDDGSGEESSETSSGGEASDDRGGGGNGEGSGGDLASSGGGPDGIGGAGAGGTSLGGASLGDGGSSPGSGGSEPAPVGLVPVFVAQGHLGRTVISCDDGRSWVYDQSNDVGSGTCWSGENEIECDHDEGAGRGLTGGEGEFFAMFGWGTPSTLRHTTDGSTWDLRIAANADERYGGVAYLDGTLLAAGRTSKISTDGGLTWSDGIDTQLPGFNVRRAGTAGMHFVIVGDADEVVLSEDEGLTWYAPNVLPAGCGAAIQTNGGIAFGDGTILIVGGDGTACRSTDGGRTFELSSIGGSADSHLVWSGTDFVVYGDGNAYRSPDGANFMAAPMMPSINLGPVAVSDSGTFVAIEGGWGDSVWYENQEFYRSEDGINWEVLSPGSFTGGHPMRTLAFGYLSPSDDCPLP